MKLFPTQLQCAKLLEAARVQLPDLQVPGLNTKLALGC